MEQVDIGSWREFANELRDLEELLDKASASRHKDLRGNWIFRGQSNHNWKLETTLERNHPDVVELGAYYRRAHEVKDHIETMTGRTFDAPSLIEYLNHLKSEDDPLDLREYPGFGYLAYLRHHGFPSPLLDWSESPYVAAYFAYRDAKPANDRVAIFAFCEFFDGMKAMAAGEPLIRGRGSAVPTNTRHILQHCRYTTCTSYYEKKWQYVPHQAVFDDTSPVKATQDVLIKITLPVSIRAEVMKHLDLHNLNAHTLFGTEDALVETVYQRYWS